MEGCLDVGVLWSPFLLYNGREMTESGQRKVISFPRTGWLEGPGDLYSIVVGVDVAEGRCWWRRGLLVQFSRASELFGGKFLRENPVHLYKNESQNIPENRKSKRNPKIHKSLTITKETKEKMLKWYFEYNKKKLDDDEFFSRVYKKELWSASQGCAGFCLRSRGPTYSISCRMFIRQFV